MQNHFISQAAYGLTVSASLAFQASTNGGFDFSKMFKSFSDWTISNLGPVAGLLCIVAIIFFSLGGLKRSWGQRAFDIAWRPIVGLLLLAFLPSLLAAMGDFVTTLTGNDTVAKKLPNGK